MQRRQLGVSTAGRALQLALGLVSLRVATANGLAVAVRTDLRAHAHARHAVRPVLALHPRTQFWKIFGLPLSRSCGVPKRESPSPRVYENINERLLRPGNFPSKTKSSAFRRGFQSGEDRFFRAILEMERCKREK